MGTEKENMKKKVCIFCGANDGNAIEILNHAKLLCDLLIYADYDLVYGGGNSGLMRIIANRFLNNGMQVIGVRPKMLIKEENAHDGITELIVVNSMQERKSKMVELSDVFIALPGGIGTLDEIIETYTLHKIGYIKKQSAVLNSFGYYESLETLMNKMVEKGFLTSDARSKFVMEATPEKLLCKLNIIKSNIKEIDKVALIEIKEGRILSAKSFGKDKYYIPGGKREKGESDEETLIREISEELSVNILKKSIDYVGTFIAQADGKEKGVDVRMTCYSGSFNEVLKASNEIEEIRWLNYSDIELVADVDKIIFNYLKRKGELN
ncbi:lysine decarboxylase [Maribacter sp. HTCC2170]|nr:lysine decarboxylase [Maribacter sp. HTCC2170]